MSDCYDKSGEPISDEEWSRLFMDMSYKRIAHDEIGNVRVSTIWLGLDHSFGEGLPIIFETLVFEGPLDGEMARYSTLEDAQDGHVKMVALVRAQEGE